MYQRKNFSGNLLKGILIGVLCLVLIVGVVLCVRGPKAPGSEPQDAQLSAAPTEPSEADAPQQETEPTKPASVPQETTPAQTEPQSAPTQPKPAVPEATRPQPGQSNPTEPQPTAPAPTQPQPTEPVPTEPAPTEPAPTEPAPTEPAPTEPTPTEPAPTEPEPTEPEKEIFQVLGQVSAENNVVTQDASFGQDGISAQVPSGTVLDSGTTELVLTIEKKENSDSGIATEAGQSLQPLDVHIAGVSPENTAPITICLGKILPNGMNIGNVGLYHVENGSANPMAQVLTAAELDSHNEFYYDPATGDITVAMASFSEIAVVSEPSKWEGSVDHTWYDANKTELTIANADQLWSFSQIVGGMAENIEQDSFAGKTIKLTSDVDLADKESKNNSSLIFYPIGYYSSDGTYEKTNTAITSGLRNFEGTFDGQGHTIANFYQNTWEMKGDHDWYAPENQYYRDGMGLFGRVYGGTVKNLTIKNFSSDGEITTTGTIAAYADFGAKFENIAIFNCNPRVYNIGNGGIVGCVGWYTKGETTDKVTFSNITVDNTNKISALWGSYDVACGGLVGQYYPTSGQSSANYPKNPGIYMENCHVAAQMDVYNDVCANYQYYAYRYTGMLIGSVRENVTEDGHSYPKMDGIEAKDCTVHFGDWNDYYYCELVANSLASYTHDHQFSRLEQVASVDVENMTVTSLKGVTTDIPTSGRVNYVVVTAKNDDGTFNHASENAQCYHFVDGNPHSHDDYNGDGTDDKETVNGQEIFVENNRHIYLEFNNLVTGYGWGVTSKGIGDMDGVTILDRDVADSVTKFVSVASSSYATGDTVTIGEMFTQAANLEVGIDTDNVQVFVSPVGETSTASGIYTPNTTDWTQGTLTFSGAGAATISITDYNYCKTTTINVTITEQEPAEKFVTKFTGDFLYRVGNVGTVTLGTIFEQASNYTGEIGTVTVTIENIAGNAGGTYTANATWTSGTIQFTGTGKVEVAIKDDDSYCIPTKLTLEVVDATNATSATSATTRNIVLLNNCGFSSLEVSNGYTLYGNGFTMTCASDSVAADMGYAFVTLDSGTLDNVQIICPNFDYAVLYKSNLTDGDNRSETDANGKTRYYNAKSGVMVSGNSQILNSRISGARAAVNASSGNLLIENSSIELGAVANILVGAANKVTLRDVTLVQKPTVSTYDSSKTLMGFSVLFVCDANGDAAPMTLEGELIQHAWIDKTDSEYVPSAGQSIINTVLAKTEYLHDIDGDGENESLNLGFAYMPESLTSKVNASTITDSRTNQAVAPYDYAEVAILSGKTYVYSYKNDNGTDSSFTDDPSYVPNKYSDNITVTYSDTADGLSSGKSFGTDGWVYELNVDLDKASGYALDFSKLSMSVNGVPVNNFLVDDSAKPTSPVEVVAGGTTYVLTATIEGVEYTATFKVTGTETSKESPSLVVSNYEAGVCVASSKGGTWHGAAPVLEGIQIKYWSVAEKTYKTINLSDYTPTATGKQNGTNNYWTYTPANSDFTLTITNTTYVQSSKQVYAMPVVVTDNGTNKLFFVPSSTNGLVNSGNSARTIAIGYSFKDNNNGEELKFSYTWSIEENTENPYKYSDFCNGTMTDLGSDSGSSGTCLAGDTLITLADGSQVRVDALTGDEELLVWNLETGSYDTAPIVFVDSDAQAEYEVVNLHFSDGSEVGVIYEHGFFDYDLGKYVYLDAGNAESYIGHTFVTQGDIAGNTWNTATLTDVVIETKVTTAYSPVTFSHLCYYTDGVLSMPGGIEGLFNIFQVDTATMAYDAEKKAQDIETYGLYTYEDFADVIPEDAFYAFNGAYLKVAIGKGMLTWEDIEYLAQRYVPLM